MKIADIKKTKYGYNVYSNNLKVNIETSVFNKYKLKKGTSLTKGEWDNILKENELETIKRKTLVYLSRRRSTKEFIAYLYQLKPPHGLISSLVEEYTKKGYLDDYLYAEAVIKKEKNRYGKNKIKEILINKGIKDKIIESLLIEHVDEFLEQQIIVACKTVKASNYQEAINKLSRSFLYKGYQLKEIKNFLLIHLDKDKFNEDETIKKHYLEALKKYQKKYSNDELNLKIKVYLHNKGFKKETINKVIRGE